MRLPHVCVLLALLLVGGCVLKEKPPATDTSATIEDQDVVEETPDSGTGIIMPCPIPHVTDGRFTGWPEQTGCKEWQAPPLEGVYGDLYLHYEAMRLHVLNDWHHRDENIPTSWYNLFQITTGGGAQQWDVRVFGDGKIEVLLGGEKYGQFAQGAYGFGASPRYNQPHTIFEFQLSGVLPGPIAVSEQDPGPGKWETPEQALKKEPTSFSGVLQQGGGVTDGKAHNLPVIVAITPPASEPKQPLVITGSNLGNEEGQALFAGGAVTITSWDDGEVRAIAPMLPGKMQVRVVRSDGAASNILPFTVLCINDCGGKVCGLGSCGIACGTCAGADACSDGGQCVCQPQCALPGGGKKACGDDGCGGSCGACQADQVCGDGACKPKPPECVPKCAGKSCDADGCGGVCGQCKVGQWCDKGVCACKPDCAGKHCGDDGCGGLCGQCGVVQACVGGLCSCKPSCAGKQCGKDGCGGACGPCAAGLTCTGVTCCKPDCSGKSCGWDGCSGSCGGCGAGQHCVLGKCVCAPVCNGKVCGPDGCGGSCGACKHGSCDAAGKCACTPQCKDKGCGDDGCGGACGTCDPGEQCKKGTCTST